MNVPNRLTCFRLGLAVLFTFILPMPGAAARATALFVFLLASITDWLDGKIARQTGQTSDFGKLMDPIADKFLVMAAFILFVEMRVIPGWMAVVVVMRDLFVTGVRLVAPPGEGQGVRASGKWKTALQFVFIVGVLAVLALQETALWRPEWTSRASDAILFGMLTVVAVTLGSGARFVAVNRGVFR